MIWNCCDGWNRLHRTLVFSAIPCKTFPNLWIRTGPSGFLIITLPFFFSSWNRSNKLTSYGLRQSLQLKSLSFRAHSFEQTDGQTDRGTTERYREKWMEDRMKSTRMTALLVCSWPGRKDAGDALPRPHDRRLQNTRDRVTMTISTSTAIFPSTIYNSRVSILAET